jgi:hypothetical protein
VNTPEHATKAASSSFLTPSPTTITIIMKLVVAGSTGFVATEIIRQAIRNPSITSIVGLARRETAVPQDIDVDADAAKLKSVVCDDFTNYSEDVKNDLADADACIWYIQIQSCLLFVNDILTKLQGPSRLRHPI